MGVGRDRWIGRHGGNRSYNAFEAAAMRVQARAATERAYGPANKIENDMIQQYHVIKQTLMRRSSEQAVMQFALIPNSGTTARAFSILRVSFGLSA